MRSYPGFIFRMKSPADAERVDLRPHRAPLYDDAVQYSAVFNGIAGWQLDAGLNPNGVCVDDGRLFVGLNPVHRIITVDLEDRSVEDLAVLPSGLVDGIEALGDGALAVSQAEGRLLRVTADGGVDALIDAGGLDHPFADFDIAEGAGLIVVPTFYTGHVAAYSLPRE